MECEYCNKILKTSNSLKTHQNTTKSCLAKQKDLECRNKDTDKSLKDKEELEKSLKDKEELEKSLKDKEELAKSLKDKEELAKSLKDKEDDEEDFDDRYYEDSKYEESKYEEDITIRLKQIHDEVDVKDEFISKEHELEKRIVELTNKLRIEKEVSSIFFSEQKLIVEKFSKLNEKYIKVSRDLENQKIRSYNLHYNLFIKTKKLNNIHNGREEDNCVDDHLWIRPIRPYIHIDDENFCPPTKKEINYIAKCLGEGADIEEIKSTLGWIGKLKTLEMKSILREKYRQCEDIIEAIKFVFQEILNQDGRRPRYVFFNSHPKIGVYKLPSGRFVVDRDLSLFQIVKNSNVSSEET